MSDVQTVQGPVEADELGLTLAHEHLRFRDEAGRRAWPGRYDEAAEHDDRAARGARPRQGARHPDDRRPDRDVPRARRDASWKTRRRRDRRARRRLHRHLHLRLPAALLRQPHEDVIADHFVDDIRNGHPGHRHQGGVPQVRRRRGRASTRTSRRSTARSRARACRPARRSWPTPGRPSLHRPAPGRDLRRGGRRPREGRHRPLRRHRRRRLHPGSDRQGRLRRARPLRPGHVPADRQAQRDGDRAAAPRPRRAAA